MLNADIYNWLLTMLDKIGDFLTGKEMVAAIVGGVLTLLGTKWIERRKEARAHRRYQQEQLADYVRQIARCLEGMAEEFSYSQVPHTDGRAFAELMRSFTKLDQKLSDELKSRVQTLKGLLHYAGQLDEELYETKSLSDLKPEVRDELERWILVARRLSGDLVAEAAKIEAGK